MKYRIAVTVGFAAVLAAILSIPVLASPPREHTDVVTVHAPPTPETTTTTTINRPEQDWTGFDETVNETLAAATTTTIPEPVAVTPPPTTIPPAPPTTQPVELLPSVTAVNPTQPDDDVELVPNTLEDHICGYNWDCATALRVVQCESGFDPNAVGGRGERGLFQIHPVHAGWLGARWDRMFDPLENTAVAFEIYTQQGWSRGWSCF